VLQLAPSFLRLQLPVQQSAVQVRQGSSFLFHSLRRQNYTQQEGISLCQALLSFLASAWFLKSDHPPVFEKRVSIGGSHPSSPRYPSNEVTYWRFIIYIISRTNVPVYPYVLVLSLSGGNQKPYLAQKKSYSALTSPECQQYSEQGMHPVWLPHLELGNLYKIYI